MFLIEGLIEGLRNQGYYRSGLGTSPDPVALVSDATA